MSPEVRVAEETKSVWKRKIIIPEESMSYIQIGEEMMVIRDIHRTFSETEIGQRLNKNIRWSMYAKELDLEDGEWQKTLGYDVNNLEHGQLTYGIAYLFLNEMEESDSEIRFSLEEKRLILLTSLVHDWPEGFTKEGDVNFNYKDKKQEEKELSVIEQIIVQIFGEESAEKAAQVKEIMGNTTTKLGNFFNSIEYTGYLATGKKLGKKVKKLVI